MAGQVVGHGSPSGLLSPIPSQARIAAFEPNAAHLLNYRQVYKKSEAEVGRTQDGDPLASYLSAYDRVNAEHVVVKAKDVETTFGIKAPNEAIAQVRAARPGAIETREQERWVHAQSAVDAARDARSSRQLACLLGGAVGDALGYRVEFDSLAAIRRKYGEEGIRLANADGLLEVSDDTQMSLFTLEGQLRAAQDGVPLHEAIANIKNVPIDGQLVRTARDIGISFSAPKESKLGEPAMYEVRTLGS